jgi:hypothetical protein
MQSQKLANFIIAGVNKAGSTSIFHYLSEHPEVCGSRDKETCYFLPLLYGKQPGPIAHYAEQFSKCSGSPYRMEATPAYIFGKEKIAHAIHKTLGEVKILIILKDPVERLLSFYKRKKATFQLSDKINLQEYVDRCLAKTPAELALHKNQIYTLGYYDEYIGPWFETFGKNLKVVFFDDLAANPMRFMKDICDWLDIDASFYDQYSFAVKNKSLEYRNASMQRLAVKANKAGQLIWRNNPTLKQRLLSIYYKINGKPYDAENFSPAVIEFLNEHFRPHNQKLEEILRQHGITHMPAWLGARELVPA